jgi:hypothetical protein
MNVDAEDKDADESSEQSEDDENDSEEVKAIIRKCDTFLVHNLSSMLASPIAS